MDDSDRTELDVSMPENSTVRLEGINVDLVITGITGNTQVEIVNGPIEASKLSGHVDIETVNGSIEATDLDGRIHLSTVTGQVRDTNSKGTRVNYSAVMGSIMYNTPAERVGAECVSGSVQLDLGKVGDLEASCISGHVIVSLDLLPGGNVEISTVSGDIVIGPR